LVGLFGAGTEFGDVACLEGFHLLAELSGQAFALRWRGEGGTRGDLAVGGMLDDLFNLSGGLVVA
jgi:hypothetical protein